MRVFSLGFAACLSVLGACSTQTLTQSAAPPPATITAQVARPAPFNPLAGVTAAVATNRANCAADFYPAEMARQHIEGTVGVKILIGTDGVPRDVAVEKSSGHIELDRAALACVATFRYKPAMKDGQPIEIPWHPVIVWKIL